MKVSNCLEDDPSRKANNSLDDVSYKDALCEAHKRRFNNFIPKKITLPLYRVFTAGRRFREARIHEKNLPPTLYTIQDL